MFDTRLLFLVRILSLDRSLNHCFPFYASAPEFTNRISSWGKTIRRDRSRVQPKIRASNENLFLRSKTNFLNQEKVENITLRNWLPGKSIQKESVAKKKT
ncbi:hypothetical protein DLM78_07520 [Leptospira stimsonii]|uniref:Uncharacterized protein n=1 Tax=Leptospira stimsonii TaxID=2202203 RepID=A0A8B3CU28_9LEPT|nr:hypothetical protein DLM78_07520 [Leptospira stimsonii]